jgi:tight adherence protein C
MRPWLTGALIGGTAASGLWLVAAVLMQARRPSLVDRVGPYLHDLPRSGRPATLRQIGNDPGSVARAVFGPSLHRLAGAVERVLGGSAAVRRRLQRLSSDQTVEDFRVQQVLWGAAACAGVSMVIVLWSAQGGSLAPAPALIACAAAFAAGVLARDQALGTAVRRREEQIVAEFPSIADLLALSVAAGEGPVAAIERVVQRSEGELARDLARVLGEVRTGTPVTRAFDALAARTGVPVLARFAEGLAVALDRGTPLVDVLHAQAADVREAGRRVLIETGARKEVAMMLPVVFLILPVTVLFAIIRLGYHRSYGLDCEGVRAHLT